MDYPLTFEDFYGPTFSDDLRFSTYLLDKTYMVLRLSRNFSKITNKITLQDDCTTNYQTGEIYPTSVSFYIRRSYSHLYLLCVMILTCISYGAKLYFMRIEASRNTKFVIKIILILIFSAGLILEFMGYDPMVCTYCYIIYLSFFIKQVRLAWSRMFIIFKYIYQIAIFQITVLFDLS